MSDSSLDQPPELLDRHSVAEIHKISVASSSRALSNSSLLLGIYILYATLIFKFDHSFNKESPWLEQGIPLESYTLLAIELQAISEYLASYRAASDSGSPTSRDL